jgi:hypothetical protein
VRHAISAADQLDNDIDLGVRRHRDRVLVPAHGRQIDAAVAASIARGYRCDNNSPARTLGKQISLAIEQLQHPGSDGAETGYGDPQRRFHDSDPNAVCDTQKPPRQKRSRPLCSAQT